jgi:hypothetical protein
MKINPNLIPLAYQLSKQVYLKELKAGEAVSQMASNGQMNLGSAKHYIDNFKYMMNGRRFSMTLNTASMDYFLMKIHEDFQEVGLTNALLAFYLHIKYYEGIQKKKMKMKSMWLLFDKYKRYVPLPQTIVSLHELIDNIETLENHLVSSNDASRDAAQRLVKQGTCFVAYIINGDIRFAPSRYLGYKDNKPYKYRIDVDGRETNNIISKILGSSPVEDKELESSYLTFCSQLGFVGNAQGRFGVTRKYWVLKIDQDFTSNEEILEGFPEGKMVERLHKTKERNRKVIELAKSNFKKKHGKLFCQVCEFDFTSTYGDLGSDFIEGHHTVWVSDMPTDYKTKPEEIAMLCANCHRMVHRRRPWLTMENLALVLAKES